MALMDNLKELEALKRMLASTSEGVAFGHEVRQARTKRGMTLESLAGATGMAKSYLSQIETGYAPPPREDKVRKIAKAVGLDEDALVARAHLSQLPADLRERIARLKEIFDSAEEVIRALLVAKGEGHGTPTASREGPGPAGEETSLDLDALHKSGLLHHLAEWGALCRAGPPASPADPRDQQGGGGVPDGLHGPGVSGGDRGRVHSRAGGTIGPERVCRARGGRLDGAALPRGRRGDLQSGGRGGHGGGLFRAVRDGLAAERRGIDVQTGVLRRAGPGAAAAAERALRADVRQAGGDRGHFQGGSPLRATVGGGEAVARYERL